MTVDTAAHAEQMLWERVGSVHTALGDPDMVMYEPVRAQALDYLGFVTDELMATPGFVRSAVALGERALAEANAFEGRAPLVTREADDLTYAASIQHSRQNIVLPEDPLTTALGTRSVRTFGQLQETIATLDQTQALASSTAAPRVPVVIDANRSHTLGIQSGARMEIVETNLLRKPGAAKADGTRLTLGEIRSRAIARILARLQDESILTSRDINMTVRDVLGRESATPRINEGIIRWMGSSLRAEGRPVVTRTHAASERRLYFAIDPLFRVVLSPARKI